MDIINNQGKDKYILYNGVIIWTRYIICVLNRSKEVVEDEEVLWVMGESGWLGWVCVWGGHCKVQSSGWWHFTFNIFACNGVAKIWTPVFFFSLQFLTSHNKSGLWHVFLMLSFLLQFSLYSKFNKWTYIMLLLIRCTTCVAPMLLARVRLNLFSVQWRCEMLWELYTITVHEFEPKKGIYLTILAAWVT